MFSPVSVFSILPVLLPSHVSVTLCVYLDSIRCEAVLRLLGLQRFKFIAALPKQELVYLAISIIVQLLYSMLIMCMSAYYS
jgi:hypothetical protein